MEDSIKIKITMKRLQNELKLLEREPMEYIDTHPDENNMFIWYFLVRGPEKSDYEGGSYIGKIMLSPGYPNTPVDFMMLTPNGRFEIDKKICLTNSGYHADQWTPIWNMRVILLAFMSIMLADDTTGISHIKRSSTERKQLASNSYGYNIQKYEYIFRNFKRFIDNSNGFARLRTSEEIKELDSKNDKKKKKSSKQEKLEEPKQEQLKLKPEEPEPKLEEPEMEEPEPELEEPEERKPKKTTRKKKVLNKEETEEKKPKKSIKKKMVNEAEPEPEPELKEPEEKKPIKSTKKKKALNEEEMEEPELGEKPKKSIKKKKVLNDEEDKPKKSTKKKALNEEEGEPELEELEDVKPKKSIKKKKILNDEDKPKKSTNKKEEEEEKFKKKLINKRKEFDEIEVLDYVSLYPMRAMQKYLDEEPKSLNKKNKEEKEEKPKKSTKKKASKQNEEE